MLIEVVEFGSDKPVNLNQQLLFGLAWIHPSNTSLIKQRQQRELNAAAQLAFDPSNAMMRKELRHQDTHLQYWAHELAKGAAKFLASRVPVDGAMGTCAKLVPEWFDVLLEGVAYIPHALDYIDGRSDPCYCIVAKKSIL